MLEILRIALSDRIIAETDGSFGLSYSVLRRRTTFGPHCSLKMDDPSQDPVCVEDDFDASHQDPVYVGDQFDSRLQSRCGVSPNNPCNEKIVKVKILESKPSGTVSLNSLSVQDVCHLLEHCQLNAIASVARENQFSGVLSLIFLCSRV